jgi:hypothetical protein
MVRRIRNFFYSLRSEYQRIWILFASYSHVSVYSQISFIRIIRFIFASKYSHRFAKKYSIDAKNTCCSEYSLQSEYSLKIFSYWQIFTSKYSLRSEYSQNVSEFHIQANICLQIFAYKRLFACKYSHNSEYSQANICLQIFAYKRLFACKYSHNSEYSLPTYLIASIYLEKPFTRLRPQLLLGSFWKYLLRRNIRFRFYSFRL